MSGFDGKATLLSAEKLERETARLNEIATMRPIKDEIEMGPYEPEKFDMPGCVTSDEESELPGTRCLKKGEGWGGMGPVLTTQRKGFKCDLTDGAGSCSPGRWKIEQQFLPDDFLAKSLR